MVCTFNCGIMAAMVRLLASRTHLEITSEEATHEKIAFQAINREFLEADEANLLEEEDMYVFDSRPLADPLHLVSCNACKKPIKASQYAAHAERCRTLNALEDTSIEFDGGCSHKKPTRKGRKKSQTPHDNKGSHIGELEKSESVDGDGVAGSDSNLDEHAGPMSSLSGQVKRVISNVPAPLATKLYYLRGNYRLRAALSHLYVESAVKDIGNNSTLKVLQDSIMHDIHRGYAAKKTDQNLSQGTDSCIGGSGIYISDVTSPNQIQVGDFPRSGRIRYHTSPNSFPINSGSALGNMQQQNGSVQVVL